MGDGGSAVTTLCHTPALPSPLLGQAGKARHNAKDAPDR